MRRREQSRRLRRYAVLPALALLLSVGLTSPPAQSDPGSPQPPAAPESPAPKSPAPANDPGKASAYAETRPEQFDIVIERDVPITMRDGRVLRADIHRPAVRGTQTPADGEFPVILVQTPYGKSVGNSGLGEMSPYLVRRGYVGVIVDVAGTGGSEGQSQLFGTSEALDGAEMVEWSAALDGSNGTVGLLGGSYLGIDQVFTAAAVGPDSPLKAIFPIATASDPYRDLFVAGGIVNLVSSVGLIGGYFGLRTFTPFAERMSDPADALRLSLEHGLAGIPFELTTGIHALTDTGRVHDSAYWQERAPQNVLDKVVANDVAAYLVGGQYDVFQRGEPLLYSGLQNAWSGRSVWAPMEPGQQVTSRYQLLTGPWDHGKPGQHRRPGCDRAGLVRPLAQGRRHRDHRHHDSLPRPGAGRCVLQHPQLSRRDRAAPADRPPPGHTACAGGTDRDDRTAEGALPADRAVVPAGPGAVECRADARPLRGLQGHWSHQAAGRRRRL